METLYRKEQILNIIDQCFKMYASDYRNDARIYATKIIEEVPTTIKPDNTEVIQQLEAEKAELLEALEYAVKWFYSDDLDEELGIGKIESLIQKHRKGNNIIR